MSLNIHEVLLKVSWALTAHRHEASTAEPDHKCHRSFFLLWTPSFFLCLLYFSYKLLELLVIKNYILCWFHILFVLTVALFAVWLCLTYLDKMFSVRYCGITWIKWNFGLCDTEHWYKVYIKSRHCWWIG